MVAVYLWVHWLTSLLSSRDVRDPDSKVKEKSRCRRLHQRNDVMRLSSGFHMHVHMVAMTGITSLSLCLVCYE